MGTCECTQSRALTTTACTARHRGSARRRWHIAPSCRHILVSTHMHALWQNDARSCDAPWPHSLQRDMRGEKRPLVSSLFSPTRRPPDAAPATAMRDVLAPVPEFTRKPAALRLRLLAATHEWVRWCDLLEGLLALFAHHRGAKDSFASAHARTHAPSSRADTSRGARPLHHVDCASAECRDHQQRGALLWCVCLLTDPYIFKVTFECISPLEDGARVSLLIRHRVEADLRRLGRVRGVRPGARQLHGWPRARRRELV